MIFKLVGVIGVIVAITGMVLIITGFGDFESNNFMIGGFLTVIGIMAGFCGIIIGFSPEIAKAKTRAARYIQEENKDDLTALASNTAEIMSDAVTTTTSAAIKGMRKTIFCKHCGQEIDGDSKFCSFCGKEQ